MKLQFKVQDYQTAAVDAVVDCFGAVHRQPFADNVTYKIDPGRTVEQRDQPELDHRLSEAVARTGYGNSPLLLSSAQLLDNVQAVQRRTTGLPLSGELVASPAAGLNLDVEMETGTGKTYVYIKTIMELHRQYGWSKFVVVVPSVAIREGVKKSSRSRPTTSSPSTGLRPERSSTTPIISKMSRPSRRMQASRS